MQVARHVPEPLNNRSDQSSSPHAGTQVVVSLHVDLQVWVKSTDLSSVLYYTSHD